MMGSGAEMASEREMVAATPGSDAPGDGRYNSMLSCLIWVARRQGLFLSEEQLMLDNQLTSDRVAPQELVFIAERLGMRARTLRGSTQSLVELRRACPVIAMLRSGGAIVINEIKALNSGIEQLELIDVHGEYGNSIVTDIARFEEAWTGELIVLKRKFELADSEQPFSLRFVAGLVFGEKKLVRDISIAAVLMGALMLMPILYYRLLANDVIAYSAENTFWFLTSIVVWVIVILTVLTAVRQYMLSLVITRVDARVNEYIFDKLLALPVDYFERTQVGQITYSINQAGKIRDFMAGQLFGTLLDSTLLLFFVPVMIYISWMMSLVVFVTMGAIMTIIILMMPTIRAVNGRVIAARVASGSFLYQTIAGIRTVKSLALEARQRAKWDGLVAETARRELELATVANRLRVLVFPLEQIAMIGAFALGAYVTIRTHDPGLSTYLFAFLMLSQRVTSPLLQLSKLVEQFDDARLALVEVSRVVNVVPEENAGERGVRKPIIGQVEFSNLKFKYKGSQTFALDGVNFQIPVGTTLGLVGRSGSGKTTVTRLLQRLHSEYEGLIKIDGVDVREYDLHHLRRSLGVVLQENFLFSGTIRDNIVAAKPSASFDDVVNACRMAGAEEFIDRLPHGYDTWIYEGSPNLSGGQRQRLAIARALVVDPRILILDEATSALDPDSEAIVNDNIRRIAEGRTMLVISHRLSSLVNSDAILVLERGSVVDVGSHQDLLERCDIYRNLWNQQNRHTAAAARQAVRGPSRVS
jgi:ATP-binding cassette, subfamily B, bacterial HlyB/CyaB